MLNNGIKTILFILCLPLPLYNSLIFYGCSDPKNTDLSIPNSSCVKIPPILMGMTNSSLKIIGQGFVKGDKLIFSSVTNPYVRHEFPVIDVVDKEVYFFTGSQITSGDYNITVRREAKQAFLGTTSLSISSTAQIPDIPEKNIKGVVSCNGRGIPDVTVSDGVEVTKTNASGVYYLESNKDHGYVFISIPSNYEVPIRNNLPFFFQYLTTDTRVVDQRDFELNEADNSNHIMILMADMHLANRLNDLEQFMNGFGMEVKTLANSKKNKGFKVYGLTLGDMTWESFWYTNSYALPEYINQVKDFGFQIFNTMGNHDNDPYKEGDFFAESTYKKIVGPTYYSFNLGAIHYIVLDNILYINTGGTKGKVGDKSYKNGITLQQLEWLSKDLETIKDKSMPIVIATHIPIHSSSLNSSGEQVNKVSLNNGSELLSLFKDFTNVQIISGHSHVNCNFEVSNNIYERNIAAVCGTWWNTGALDYPNLNVCKDGSPGGYGVFEVRDKNIEYYFKGIGYDRNQQFRSYDRNAIIISDKFFTPNANAMYKAKVVDYAGEYAFTASDNKVYINVFNYDDSCNLEVKENGTNLFVFRKLIRDPFHIIAYEMQRLNHNFEPTPEFVTNSSKHIFEVTASNPNSTLHITLTDRYGNEYSELMVRPKEFNVHLK